METPGGDGDAFMASVQSQNDGAAASVAERGEAGEGKVVPAPRKRGHGADSEEEVRAAARKLKRARTDNNSGLQGVAMLNTIAGNPDQAHALINGIDDSTITTISDAMKARRRAELDAKRAELERVSPFNPMSPVAAEFGDIFCTCVLPFLSPLDTCALRNVSRKCRAWVTASGRVSLTQLAFAISDPVLSDGAYAMVKRFLEHTDDLMDVSHILMSAIGSTCNAGASADIIEHIIEQVKACVPGMSRFYTLFYCTTRFGCTQQPNRGDFATAPKTWRAVCAGVPPHILTGDDAGSSDDSDSGSDDWDAVLPSRGPARFSLSATKKVIAAIYRPGYQHTFSMYKRTFEADEWRLQSLAHTLIQRQLDKGMTCMSSRLLKILLAERVVSKNRLCRTADQFAAGIIKSAAVMESAALPIRDNIDALEFLLEFLDDCTASGDIIFTMATNALIHCKVSAPLIDILRVRVVDKKRAAGPLTKAAKANNPTALKYIARRALAQNITSKAQSRVVTIVAQKGYFECLRVLCSEFFTFAPPTLVKLIINSRLPWATNAKMRNQAFDAILGDVGLCVARGTLETMITQLNASMNLKIYPRTRHESFPTLTRITVDTWGATTMGDFLSALWRATSGDARFRTTIVNMESFREAVNRALIAHVGCVFLPAVSAAGAFNDTDGVDDAMAALLSRISELFDMQRRTDFRLDLEDGSVEALNPISDDANSPIYISSMRGVVLDRWLRKVFVSASTAGMRYINAACSATDEIAGIFEASVVHTDMAFETVLEEATAPDELNASVLDPRWVAALLFKACAPRGSAVAMRSALARRLMRWCQIVQKHASWNESGKPRLCQSTAVAMHGVLHDIASSITVTGADGEMTLKDVKIQPKEAYFNDRVRAESDDERVPTSAVGPVPPCSAAELPFADEAAALCDFVTDACAENIGGVEILYRDFNGNISDALTTLTAGMDDGHIVPQPDGDVRDIVVYSIASLRGVPSDPLINIIDKTVARYTMGVTLPCAWSVVGGLGGVTSTRTMSRWLRDLLRGRREHTVWWVRPSTVAEADDDT